MWAILLSASALGAELPPEIEVDRLVVRAERETGQGEHWSAVGTLERVLEIYQEHGLEVPAEFWFRRAGALQNAGLHERAIQSATRYLREAGQEGEMYKAALELLDASEADLAEERRESVRVRAEAERRARALAAKTRAMETATPEMVEVSYWRGSFELSKTETTFAQWDVCTEYGPCRLVSDEGWGRGSRPVVNVSWHDAQTYVRWLSQATGEHYRLPSAREWDHAALAGSKTKYSWGRRIGRNLANCHGCGSRWDGSQTAPVGSFAANEFGIHDMHGNVAEWVQNCYRTSSNAPFGPGWGPIPIGHRDDRSDCRSRAILGGSFLSKPKRLRIPDKALYGRSARPDRAYGDMGFRVARNATKNERH